MQPAPITTARWLLNAWHGRRPNLDGSLGKLVGPGEYLSTSPMACGLNGAVQLEVASLQYLLLPLHGIVRELAVVGGHREISEGVQQLVVDRLRIDPIGCQRSVPVIAQGL